MQQDCVVASYADDTTLIVSNKTDSSVENDCNNNLSKLLNWFSNNHLYLNLEKTNYIQFRTPQHKKNTNLKITINNNTIKGTATQKFLGVILDENLNWKNHCDSLIKNLNSYCYLIKNLSNILTLKQLIIFYRAVIESRLRYGICFWGASPSINDVLICQKRIIRSLMRIDRSESCKPSFKKLEILTVIGVYIFELCLFTYKNKEHFQKNSNIHHFDTRSRHNIHLDFTHLSLKKNTPNILGPKLFNNLPNYIKNSKSINIFKKQLKLYLTPLAIYSVKDFFGE